MKSNKSLVITSCEDPHCDYVINKFNEQGLQESIIRLNTEDFLTNAEISFSNKSFRVKLRDSQKDFSNDEIISVWFRRPKKINFAKYGDKGIDTFVEQQANAVLRGLYFCMHDTALWINSLTSMHRARIKLQQIFLAQEINFNVPATLITNKPSEAIAFFDEHKLICNKSIDEPNFSIDGRLYPYLTKLVKTRDDIEKSFEGISSCPTLFQQYIDKAFDIRVIVLGKQIFAFEIHSQADELSKIDFRGKSPDNLEHKLHQLPDDISNKILEFMKRQGLVYSAFDFVYSRDNNYYFIENNCNGQWLWLELLTGVKISDTLIELLLNGQDAIKH